MISAHQPCLSPLAPVSPQPDVESRSAALYLHTAPLLTTNVQPTLGFSPPQAPIHEKHGNRFEIRVSISPFRINTCKSVSKQRTLSAFRMNTYAKPRGRGSR